MIDLKEFSCFRPLSISSYLYFYCYQKGCHTFTIYIERKRSQIFMPINDNTCMCTFLFSCLFVYYVNKRESPKHVNTKYLLYIWYADVLTINIWILSTK